MNPLFSLIFVLFVYAQTELKISQLQFSWRTKIKTVHNQFTGVSKLNQRQHDNYNLLKILYMIIYVWLIKHVAVKWKNMGISKNSIIKFLAKELQMESKNLGFYVSWLIANYVLYLLFLLFTFPKEGDLIDNRILAMVLEIRYGMMLLLSFVIWR